MKFKLAVILLFLSVKLMGQSANIPLNPDYYHLLDRYEIKSGQSSKTFFTSFKPYQRNEVIAFLDSIEDTEIFTSPSDLFNQQYLEIDSWEFQSTDLSDSEKPLWKKFYRKKSDFIHVYVPDFDVHLNPVIYWSIGNDSDSRSRPFVNTRGVGEG